MYLRTKLILIILGGVIIITLLTAGSYFLGRNSKQAANIDQEQNQITPNTDEGTVKQENENQNNYQSIFEDSNHRFNFKYPTDWTAEELNPNLITLISNERMNVALPQPYNQKFKIPDISVQIINKPIEQNLIDYYRGISDNPVLYAETTEIKEVDGRQTLVLRNIPGMVVYSLAAIDFGNTIVEISDPTNLHQDDSVFESIVSSVRTVQ